MTVTAGVRCAEFNRQIGAGNTETMIPSRIDDHIGLRWHVAVNAERAGGLSLMVVMFSNVVGTRNMALPAESVSLESQ